MTESWNEDSLNFVTAKLARSARPPFYWRKCWSSFFGPRWFEAGLDRGARFVLDKTLGRWRVIFYASAPWHLTVATGSQLSVLEAAVNFAASGDGVLLEVEWEDRGHYRFGWNPRSLDRLAVIHFERPGSYATVFGVSHNDPEHAFWQGPDIEANELLRMASQLLLNGLPEQLMPRPRVLHTSIGAFPCRLSLEKMRVVARCPRGRFAFVYRGPNVHELRFKDEDGDTHLLGTGIVEELLEQTWGVPTLRRSVTSTAKPTTAKPSAAKPSAAKSSTSESPTLADTLIAAVLEECRRTGLTARGPLPYDDATRRLIDRAIDRAATLVDVRVEPIPRDILELLVRERARRSVAPEGIAGSDVIEVTARETRMPVPWADEGQPPAAARTERVGRAGGPETALVLELMSSAPAEALARIGGLHRLIEEESGREVTIAEPSELDIVALRELLVEHLDFVLASLPAKKPGASSARRLLAAFLAAFDDDHGDIEGTYAVVIEELRPYMDRGMSVRAAIDAFALLDPLTPLLTRKHGRCLAVLVGQARDPGSAVVEALSDLRRR